MCRLANFVHLRCQSACNNLYNSYTSKVKILVLAVERTFASFRWTCRHRKTHARIWYWSRAWTLHKVSEVCFWMLQPSWQNQYTHYLSAADIEKKIFFKVMHKSQGFTFDFKWNTHHLKLIQVWKLVTLLVINRRLFFWHLLLLSW